jgi:hypothetical protein
MEVVNERNAKNSGGAKKCIQPERIALGGLTPSRKPPEA